MNSGCQNSSLNGPPPQSQPQPRPPVPPVINPLTTVYATKRRKRSSKRSSGSGQMVQGLKVHGNPSDLGRSLISSGRPTGNGSIASGSADSPASAAKSNPSKRHRERLNGELDHLASLLPFEHNIISKLDRLSILRLAVAYLRTKTYFQVSTLAEKEDQQVETYLYRREFLTYDNQILDGDHFLQALNGFLMILDCNGELFFSTHSIEIYLGFHQSDVIHQSVYELVHSEDREDLQRQLMWNARLCQEDSGLGLQDILASEQYQHLLERSFTVRFRCLLDNTSGFLRLDIRGHIKILHGQNKNISDSPLALFCICTPFGPPSLLEIPQKEVLFKSKHKMDLSFISLDQRGKELLRYEDEDMNDLGGYDLIHYNDLTYVASSHQELLKTGASGMIAYRMLTKDMKWQWLQTSSRLVYKNSKPDFIISTHRPLMEDEGKDLLSKRTMDFKVTYLDAGLCNTYFNESEFQVTTNGLTIPSTTQSTVITSTANSLSSLSPSSNKVSKRYKSNLRDFLSTCRSKRKAAASVMYQPTPPSPMDNSSAAVIAAAAAGLPTGYTYSQLQAVDPLSTAVNQYVSTDHSLYMQQTSIPGPLPYQNIYQPVDQQRYFTNAPNPSDYIASYRSLTASYYPEYAHAHAQYNYFENATPPPHLRTQANLSTVPYSSTVLPSNLSLDHHEYNRYFDEKSSNSESKYSQGSLSPGSLPPLVMTSIVINHGTVSEQDDPKLAILDTSTNSSATELETVHPKETVKREPHLTTASYSDYAIHEHQSSMIMADPHGKEMSDPHC